MMNADYAVKRDIGTLYKYIGKTIVLSCVDSGRFYLIQKKEKKKFIIKFIVFFVFFKR